MVSLLHRATIKKKKKELEMWPMPNVMAALPNIDGALCESSTIPFLVPRCKVWLTPASGLECRAVSLPIQDAKKSPSGHHRTTLSGYIFAIKARIDNRKKNLLSSNMSSTCPHNMVKFGLLAAEIG